MRPVHLQEHSVGSPVFLGKASRQCHVTLVDRRSIPVLALIGVLVLDRIRVRRFAAELYVTRGIWTAALPRSSQPIGELK